MVWRTAESHSSTANGASNSKLHSDLWLKWIDRHPNATKEEIYKQRDIIEKKVWGNTTGDTPAQ